jgi:hypothetical protein
MRGTYVVSPNRWITIGRNRIDQDMVVGGESIFSLSNSDRLWRMDEPGCGRRVEPEDLPQDRDSVRHFGDVVQGDRLIPENLVDFRSKFEEDTGPFQ